MPLTPAEAQAEGIRALSALLDLVEPGDRRFVAMRIANHLHEYVQHAAPRRSPSSSGMAAVSVTDQAAERGGSDSR